MSESIIPQRGFSLIELSIVLVILGLLTGGVLTGQTLIRASELRSITVQQDKFLTATLTFKDKYFALPGDMTNATDVWGAADSDPVACRLTVSAGTQTCNGNGNGSVGSAIYPWQILLGGEEGRFWQHLANAGLIEGGYNGVSESPQSKLGNLSWLSSYAGTQGSGVEAFFYGKYDHIFQLGDPNALPANNVYLRPSEAWDIDVKIDDGKPARGKLVVVGIYEPCCGPGHYEMNPSTCTSAGSPSQLDGTYLLTSDAIGCSLVFRQQY